MRYRELGRTGIKVSEVGFGLWTISSGWWGEHGQDQAKAMLRLAFDLGVTFFDTADVYGDGYGEVLLGDALGDIRDRCVYATKIGYDWEGRTRDSGQREHPQDFSPAFVRRSVEASLCRLRTDRIDWLQLHNPRMATLADDDLFAELESLEREGKVRAWGAALGPAIGWRDEGVFAIEQRRAPALQIIHNLLEQDPGRDFIAAARATGAGFVARVPHSSGLLEGHYTLETTFPPGDHRNHRKREWLVEGVQKVDQLRWLERDDRTLGQAAIQWLLAEPQMAAILPNIYDESQLREFAAASDSPPLTPSDIARIDALYASNFGLSVAAAAEAAP
jgi:aryl-alcohol dehydrogenase-like predicted oxidoreductase